MSGWPAARPPTISYQEVGETCRSCQLSPRVGRSGARCGLIIERISANLGRDWMTLNARFILKCA